MADARVLKFANAAAAVSCTRLGAMGSAPTLADVEQMLTGEFCVLLRFYRYAQGSNDLESPGVPRARRGAALGVSENGTRSSDGPPQSFNPTTRGPRRRLARRLATSTSIARSSGAEPIVPPGSSSNTRRPNRSRTPDVSSVQPRSKRPISRRASICRAFPPRSADLLSRAVPEPDRSRRLERADRRQPSRRRRHCRRTRRATSPSRGRPTRWARDGASTPRWAACASTRPCARWVRTSSFMRRHHLRRRAAASRGDAGRWARVEEPGDAREEQGRRNARRVSRQPPLQPARRERAPLQRLASQFVIWDDHEVLNNWYPTEILGADCRTPSTASRSWPRARSARSRNTRRCASIRPIPSASIGHSRFGPLVEIFGFDMRSYRGRELHESPDRPVRRIGDSG